MFVNVHLFRQFSGPPVSVGTASIPVLNTLQRLYIFTHESWFTLSPEVISLLTHYQGRSAGITMKSFKDSSNKLGPLGFISQSVWSTRRNPRSAIPQLRHMGNR